MWSSADIAYAMTLIDWQVVWPIAGVVMGFLILLRVVYTVNQGRVRSGAIHRDQWSGNAKWLFPLGIFVSCLVYGVIRFLDQVRP